jgi:hypothetical protein
MVEDSSLDSIFAFLDFVILGSMFLIFFLTVATKEGYINTMQSTGAWFLWLRNFGLTKNISLISIFSLVYVN